MDKEGMLLKVGLYTTRAAFTIVTETACLLHDIGNPPFGHFGEGVIATWFRKFDRFQSPEFGKIVVASPEFRDLRTFDGNAQGFRIATRLGGDHIDSGFEPIRSASLLRCLSTLHSGERPRFRS